MNIYKTWQILPTRQSKEILTELIEAKSEPKAALLINDTGMSKTNTVDLFALKYKINTYKITVGASFKLVDVIDSLCEIMGIEHDFSLLEIRKKIKLIAKHVAEVYDEKNVPVIIIDEAENLRPSVLELIKELYDAVIENCSIVLIGTPQILSVIHNTRKRNRKGCPQLWRRFKAGTRYISPINKAKDFKAFFDLYIPEETSLQALLIQLCENYGELNNYLDPALRKAANMGKPLTEELFRLFHKLPAPKK